MSAALLPLLLACIHPTPPGPSPAEQVAMLPEPVVMPVEGSSVVYLQATLNAGSAYDPVGQEGAAWLTAQLLRQGGTTTRSPEQVDQLLYDLGAQIEVVVDKELVTFRGKALADDIDAFQALFTELLLQPGFDPAAFSRLKDSATDALSVGILDSDENLGHQVFDVWLHEGHPYGHPIQGRTGALEPLDLAQVQAFYTDHYVRHVTTVGIAGAVTDTLAQSFTQAFTALPGTLSDSPTPLHRPTVAGRSLLVVEKPTASVGVHFGHPIDVHRGHPDYPALLLAMTAFGQHRESHGRLYRALRTERGLNYGDYAYLENYVQAGWSSTQELGTARLQPHFYVWLRPIEAADGAFGLKLALRMTEQLHADGLEAEEFERMRSYMASRVRLWAQDPGRRLGFAIEAAALGQPNLIETLPQAMTDLTLEQVNAAITTHLRPEDLRVVVVAADGEAFSGLLVEGIDTPLVNSPVEPSDQAAAADAETASYDVNLVSWSVLSAEGVFQ